MNGIRHVFYPFILLLFFVELALGQGARSTALANSNVTLEDEGSILNNIAGAASANNVSMAATYENRFGLASFNTLTFAATVPAKIGVAGISLSRYGNNLYNESNIGIGFAHQIDKVRIGIKASYSQFHIEEYGSRGLLVVEFGGIAQIFKNLSLGAHIYNLNRAKVSQEQKEAIPVIMKVGVGYQPIEKLLVVVQIEKTQLNDPRFRAALEYEVIKRLDIRTGITTNPVTNTFGLGLELKSFEIDYALSSFQGLGFQNSISIIYKLKKR